MADSDPLVSVTVLDAFAELVGLEERDDRFSAFTELVEKYAFHVKTLHTSPIDNALAPALTYTPPPPSSTDATIQFDFSSQESPPVPSADDLAFATLSELARLVSTRQVSPVELAEHYLDRLETMGPKLHCVVTMTRDLAMDQARQAEQEIMDGNYRGPLHGIPWGAKDLLATKGIPTTWGATPYKDQIPDEDSAVVSRLTSSGAVLAAKLSMGSLASGAHWFGGMTRNPWNTETESGGSSAGPGAATAAGLVGFSIGTETHGSIASPSHTCGVTGLRPTFGRVSRYGAMALGYSLDKIGPMCRSAEACAAVFSVIAGSDDRDSATTDAGFVWPSGDARSLRIGFVEAEYDKVEEEGAAVVDREALKVLKDLAADLSPVTLPGVRTGIMLTIWVEAAAAFDELTRSKDLDLLKEHDNSRWPEIFRAARTVSATDYLRAQRLRTQLVRDFCEAMSGYDAIVCPGTGKGSLTASNMTGHPSLTLPAGFVDGMPRGMTLIGNLWDESAILTIGHAFQSTTDWHLKRPPIDA